MFVSSVLQTGKKAPSWPSLFRRRAATAPLTRPSSAASVVLKPVLATPRRDERDLAVQLQQLSPEKASHARAVAERAVVNVQALLAARLSSGEDRGHIGQASQLLASAELRACGLPPPVDPHIGRIRCGTASRSSGECRGQTGEQETGARGGGHMRTPHAQRVGETECEAVRAAGSCGAAQGHACGREGIVDQRVKDSTSGQVSVEPGRASLLTASTAGCSVAEVVMLSNAGSAPSLEERASGCSVAEVIMLPEARGAGGVPTQSKGTAGALLQSDTTGSCKDQAHASSKMRIVRIPGVYTECM